MKQAPEIRNGVVLKIKSVTGEEMDDDNAVFVYHNISNCYKKYTHSAKLKAIEAIFLHALLTA